MMPATQGLEIQLYNNYNKASLYQRLTVDAQGLRFSTALHGGFRSCSFTLRGNLSNLWQWLHAGGGEGHHFRHLQINEGQTLVWEGRIMPLELRSSAQGLELTVTALGYWNTCRDKFYYDSSIDASNTDWTAGGPHTVDDIIKEMLTNECPDIASDQSNIPDVPGNVAGITFRTDQYPQDIIVEVLAPLGDSSDGVYHFAIWDGRVPYYTARSITAVNWYVWLQDIELVLTQSPESLRNSWRGKYNAAGVATFTAAATDSESTARYPTREGVVDLTSWGNIPAARAQDARDIALAENKWPKQVESFTVTGHIYQRQTGGALIERPKWLVRAGDVLRVQDLVPESVSSPALDDIRTFYVLETDYDADRDVLVIQPDRQPSRLGVLMARANKLEAAR